MVYIFLNMFDLFYKQLVKFWAYLRFGFDLLANTGFVKKLSSVVPAEKKKERNN